jgi:glycosyltransferase involved in cell wall biosynthesis
MNKVPVSIIVPIKNEEKNLKLSLPSVAWADEVFVVDSASSDNSIAVAESLGATVVQFKFNGTWPKKKNWALENLPFRNEWVFILDADEVLPPEAEAEFRSIVSDSSTMFDGYWINRRFMFMGKWLKHAYFPNWNLRLFKHKLGRYEKLTDADTQSGDNEVHEHVIVQGETGRLNCLMDHYAFPDVATFIEKHNRYSNWEAIAQIERGKEHSEIQSGRVQMRRRLKSLFKKAPFRPFLRFCYVYFAQKGFLDGIEGYHFAKLHGVYEYLTVAKTYEMRKSRE